MQSGSPILLSFLLVLSLISLFQSSQAQGNGPNKPIKCWVCGGYEAWNAAWGVPSVPPDLSNPLQKAHADRCPKDGKGNGQLMQCPKSKTSCVKGIVEIGGASNKTLVRGCYHTTFTERCPHPPDRFNYPGLKTYCVCKGIDGCNSGRSLVGTAGPIGIGIVTGLAILMNYYHLLI